MTTRKRRPLGQTIGGVLFGFEQQVVRTTPPPEELVHHARPDDPVPAKDGSLLSITVPEGDTSGGVEPRSDDRPRPAGRAAREPPAAGRRAGVW